MLLGWPSHWPKQNNACTDTCDMLCGPCACGAWHQLEEFPELIEQYGVDVTIQLEFQLGKLYSVPYADTVVHGKLLEVKMNGGELMFKIDRPVGPIWVSQTLPRLLSAK